MFHRVKHTPRPEDPAGSSEPRNGHQRRDGYDPDHNYQVAAIRPTRPTGLNSTLRARSYDPELGRFLNRDPWPGSAHVPSSLNCCAHVANNSLRSSDPSGMCGVDIAPDVLFSLISLGFVALGGDKDRDANWQNFLPDASGAAVHARRAPGSSPGYSGGRQVGQSVDARSKLTD